jgi:hypothetical protein
MICSFSSSFAFRGENRDFVEESHARCSFDNKQLLCPRLYLHTLVYLPLIHTYRYELVYLVIFLYV